MNKIKIIHIAEAAGGVDVFLRTMFKYINHEEFYVVLICSDNYNIESYSGMVDEIFQINMKHEIDLSQDIKSISTIKDIIKKEKPDIVYAHSSKAGYLARIADCLFDNVCIYNPHGWSFNMNISRMKKQIYIFAEKFLSKFCQKIICISAAEKESAIRKKICSCDKLEVIYNGIDLEKKQSHYTKAELNIPENSIIIGMVGRLAKQKAPDIFIETARLLKNKFENLFFILVGDGEERDEIEKSIKNYGLCDSIMITGWIDNPEVYIEHFDVGLLLSRWEGFGLVLAEYMRAKKPIVATNVDAIPNIIQDGYNGLLVKVDSPIDTRNAITRILRDNELSMKLGECAYHTVCNKYDIKRTVFEHERLWKEIYYDKHKTRKI